MKLFFQAWLFVIGFLALIGGLSAAVWALSLVSTIAAAALFVIAFSVGLALFLVSSS